MPCGWERGPLNGPFCGRCVVCSGPTKTDHCRNSIPSAHHPLKLIINIYIPVFYVVYFQLFLKGRDIPGEENKLAKR